MKTLIISVFPGCGRAYAYQNQKRLQYSIANIQGQTYKDDWYKEYILNIEKYIGKVDFILISQDQEVLRELHKRNIPFVVVAPNSDKDLISERERDLIKQQWAGRLFLKYFQSKVVQEIMNNYDKLTSWGYLEQSFPTSKFLLNEDQYLSDILGDLYWKKNTYDEYNASKKY